MLLDMLKRKPSKAYRWHLTPFTHQYHTVYPSISHRLPINITPFTILNTQ